MLDISSQRVVTMSSELKVILENPCNWHMYKDSPIGKTFGSLAKGSNLLFVGCSPSKFPPSTQKICWDPKKLPIRARGFGTDIQKKTYLPLKLTASSPLKTGLLIIFPSINFQVASLNSLLVSGRVSGHLVKRKEVAYIWILSFQTIFLPKKNFQLILLSTLRPTWRIIPGLVSGEQPWWS